MGVLLKKYWAQVTQVVAFFIALAIVIGGIWYFGHLRYEKGVQDTENWYQSEIAILEAVQWSIERSAQEQVNTLMKEAENERQKTKLAIAAANSANSSLQQYTKDIANKLRETASPTSTFDVEKAARGWELLGQCSDEYSKLANVTDNQNDDLAEWQGYGGVIADLNQQ